MTNITSTSSILDSSNEINDLDYIREDYKLVNKNKQSVYLVTSDWRTLEWSEFPKGAKIVKLTVDKSVTSDDEATKEALYEQFVDLLGDNVPATMEFTKITTPDGKLAYVSKFSPEHDETVAQILELWKK